MFSATASSSIADSGANRNGTSGGEAIKKHRYQYDVSKITCLSRSRSVVDFVVPSVDDWLAIDIADEGQ
jgi:hypothetical protein